MLQETASKAQFSSGTVVRKWPFLLFHCEFLAFENVTTFCDTIEFRVHLLPEHWNG